MTRFTAFHPAPVLVVLDGRVTPTGALSTAPAQRNPAKLGALAGKVVCGSQLYRHAQQFRQIFLMIRSILASSSLRSCGVEADDAGMSARRGW